MDSILKLSCLLISISVGASYGLIAYYFVSKNEEDVIASSDDIYEDSDIDKVVIDAGDKEVILSIHAEKRLRNILNEREKSFLLYSAIKIIFSNVSHSSQFPTKFHFVIISVLVF